MKYWPLLFIIAFLIAASRTNGDIVTQCSKSLVCGVGLCCRGADGKVIPAAAQFYTDIDWWRSQIGRNPGNCTNDLAKEGEQCDSFCLCGDGLLCTPNILCRGCGNICMQREVVNKLIFYYDVGCNCLHNSLVNVGVNPNQRPNPNPSWNQDPIAANYVPNFPNLVPPYGNSRLNPNRSKPIRIVNNVVQFPGLK